MVPPGLAGLRPCLDRVTVTLLVTGATGLACLLASLWLEKPLEYLGTAGMTILGPGSGLSGPGLASGWVSV